MSTAALAHDPLRLSFTLVAEVEAPSGVHAADLEALTFFILDSESAGGSWDITVALVGDDRLQALHRDFMGIDEPTDIMTFPNADADEACGGELVISVDHVRNQAAAWGNSPADEALFLVAHGLLHLLGWRDEASAQRQRMLRRQEELLELWRERTRMFGQ